LKKINVKYIFLSLVLSLSVLTTVPAAETPVADNIEAEAWFNKSTESLDKGFWTDAVRYATVAIYYDQYFLPSFMNRAKAFIKLESFKDALLDCNYILREDPNNVERKMMTTEGMPIKTTMETNMNRKQERPLPTFSRAPKITDPKAQGMKKAEMKRNVTHAWERARVNLV